MPFTFDTFGFLASDTVEFLRRVVNRNVMAAGSAEYVFRRIRFSIQRGLAAQVVTRIPCTLVLLYTYFTAYDKTYNKWGGKNPFLMFYYNL